MLTLQPEHEALIGDALRAGVIAAPMEIVNAGAEAIRLRLASQRCGPSQEAVKAAAERLRNFGTKHGLSLEGLSIKELVDSGRR